MNLPTAEELKRNWGNVLDKAKNAANLSGRNFKNIKIIAVSKTHPVEMIKLALEAGITAFGENYAQELMDKNKEIEIISDMKPEWHFIGHLQSNKVKYIASFVNLIHSVDTPKLALEISKQAIKNQRTIDILLQVNTSGEGSKSGCHPEDIFDLAESAMELENITIRGLMTIGTFSNDEKIIRSEFTLLRSLRESLRRKYSNIDFKHLSMGMTNDYHIAIDEGATIVRVGTAIFGARDYSK